MLESYSNATKLGEKQDVLHDLNVWIIHVVGEAQRENFLEVLKKAPLQFDSYVFEFFDPIESKYLKLQKKQELFIQIIIEITDSKYA